MEQLPRVETKTHDRSEFMLGFGEEIAYLTDFYSGAWLMNLASFMEIDTHKIQTLECGSLKPMIQFKTNIRMTRDWLEFTVEHMSKWWGMANLFRHRSLVEEFIDKLKAFGNEPVDPALVSSFRNTIGIVPFMPFGGARSQEEELAFSSAMLGACLRSMSRYGFGRIIVVVPSAEVKADYERQIPHVLHYTEVIFKVASQVKTNFVDIHMPYGAITGLLKAFRNQDPEWLGTANRWNSVYFTEPDSLLHMKPQTAQRLIDGVIYKNWMLSPHRLQPIPHEGDLSMSIHPIIPVPDKDPYRVLHLESYSSFGWDGGNERPYGGKESNPKNPNKCNSFWYMCGFSSGDHSSLAPYGLMRLSNGIGIAMLRGSEHGRQCHIVDVI